DLYHVGYRATDHLLGAGGWVEDRDLANAGGAEVCADAVHQDALADRQCGLHRATRDAVGLDYERPDAERKGKRDQDDHDQLDHRAHRRFRASPYGGLHAGCSPARTSSSTSPESEELSTSPESEELSTSPESEELSTSPAARSEDSGAGSAP